MTASRREIPSIDRLLQRAGVGALEQRYGRAAVVEALRIETAKIRAGQAGSEPLDDLAAAIEQATTALLARDTAFSLRPVINATGVVIHTNLGRAPLSASAIARIAEIASGYSNLEYDLDQGARGRRDLHAERLICRLTGADAACVVNNNAAAALLTLAALAAGREVLVSRGELVEIGGGFRVPDVMAQSGAVLREVGTTNRTRVADYAAAINDRTAVILRVHPSNFRIEGFTERPSVRELAALGERFRIPLLDDLGSGHLGSGIAALRDEPLVGKTLEEGAAIVMFSGDKLLGGPQAGIIAGWRELIDRIRRHPLMRAVRADKMTYAALEATLQALDAQRMDDVPVARMLAIPAAEIGTRAERIASGLAGELSAAVIDGVSTIGGGSAPGATLSTRLLQITHATLSAAALEQHLRTLDPPVIARIEDDHVVIDLRTVLPDQDRLLARLLDLATGFRTAPPSREV